jgi:hypothetical protein
MPSAMAAQDEEVSIGLQEKNTCNLFGTNQPSDLGFSRGVISKYHNNWKEDLSRKYT